MEALVDLSKVNFQYPGHEYVLYNLDFILNEGEIVYVSGESGSGKSTFIKILNRLLEPESGRREFHGKPYDSLDVLELRKKIQLVSQTPFLLPISVRENLLLAADDGGKELVEGFMEAFKLPKKLLEKNGTELSVGQAQRVCVIRALLLKPEVILLDEPTAALDQKNRENFRHFFEKVRKEENLATVWITHDERQTVGGEGRRLNLKDGNFNN